MRRIQGYTRSVSARARPTPARIRPTAAGDARPRVLVRPALVAVALTVGVLTLGFAFAGESTALAPGLRIAGVEVGGLTHTQAQLVLERRAERLRDVPVTFVAASGRWRLTPRQLGIEADWSAAIALAQRRGEGFAPVRGLRRLRTRFFGADIAPPVRVFQPALSYTLGRMAKSVDRPPRNARLELRGLRPALAPGRSGRRLERTAAEPLVVRALAATARLTVALPVVVEPPRVTRRDLRPALADARLAVSAPVRLRLGATRWRVPRWRIAQLLQLPRDGRTELALGGARAERWLDRLAGAVALRPRDAGWSVRPDGSVTLLPGANGVRLDRARTAGALLAAARLRSSQRTAAVVTTVDVPRLTTTQARALGISRVLAEYSTPYAGTADRIANLQLAVSLLDGARIASGQTFSFNRRVGERTEARGFRAAPIIVSGEYAEGVGGGVSQVATTVFNVAWEAGLELVERVPHALYISRYPLGRDATVNFPDLDLRFRNDTRGWLVLQAFSTESGVTVRILGAPTGRRVESRPGVLTVTGAAPEKFISDPGLERGREIVVEPGTAPTTVSVQRLVYEADGRVRRDETWRTTYVGEKRVVRVGTAPPPPPPPPPPEPKSAVGKPTPPPPAGERKPQPPGSPTTPRPGQP